MSNLLKSHVPLTQEVSMSGFQGQPHRPVSGEFQVVDGTARRGGHGELVGSGRVSKGLGVEIKTNVEISSPFPHAIPEFQELLSTDFFSPL